MPALAHVLKRLVEINVLCALPPERTGKTQAMYMVANRYFFGEPFARPQPGTKRQREEDEEEARSAAKATHVPWEPARLPFPDACCYQSGDVITTRTRNTSHALCLLLRASRFTIAGG